MIYEKWDPIYKKILKDFNFMESMDRVSAELLDELLLKKTILSIKEINKLVKNKEVIIFGAGSSLEKTIDIFKKKNEQVIISADGVTTALLKKNIKPDIIFSDLDGYIPDLIKANNSGSIIIIHAHGDNIENVKKYTLKFKGKILGTTQTNPKPFKNLHNFGGFTDGDRAVFFCDHFKSKKIFLAGFDFDGDIGRYSFIDKKDKKIKLKKLDWCEYLIDMLKKENESINYFYL